MGVSKFSLNIRKISLISSVALTYSTPLMAGWNIDVTSLKDTSESTLNTLRVKCINRLQRQNDKKGSVEKWFARYTKLEEIKRFHNPSLETIKEYLIEKEQFKAPLQKEASPQQFKEDKKEEVSKPSQPTNLSSVDKEIKKLETALQTIDDEKIPQRLERLLLLQDAQKRGIMHYSSEEDLKPSPFNQLLSELKRRYGNPQEQVHNPFAISRFTRIQGNDPSIKDQVLESIGGEKGVEKAKEAKEVKNKEYIYHGDYNSVLEELLKKHGQLLKKPNSQQQGHPPHASALVKPIEKEKGKLEVREEEDKEQQASKSIINKEHEKKENPLLRALNAQFDMDEKTALPKGWELVESSQNRDISKHLSFKKYPKRIEVLGDNYTFYNNIPSLNNYDQTTFLFSVELRGTKPGTYIQYWDGVKSVSSAPYNGKGKGEWETLAVEFTVDAQKARFHRLYAAILGTTKGTDNPSVDIRSIKLEPKKL